MNKTSLRNTLLAEQRKRRVNKIIGNIFIVVVFAMGFIAGALIF